MAPATGKLLVTVVKATHLRQVDCTDWSSKAEAVVTLTAGDQHVTSKPRVNNGNPIWKESFCLPIRLQDEDSRRVAETLKIEVLEKDILGTETLGTGQIALHDLPYDVPVPKSVALTGRGKLQISLVAKDFGVPPENIAKYFSIGLLRVRVLSAVNLEEPIPGVEAQPLCQLNMGDRNWVTKEKNNTLNPEWDETKEMRVKLYGDTREALEPLNVALYSGAVGIGCMGKATIDLSNLFEGIPMPVTVWMHGQGKLFLECEATNFGFKGQLPSTVRVQQHQVGAGVLMVTVVRASDLVPHCDDSDSDYSVDNEAKDSKYYVRIVSAEEAIETASQTGPNPMYNESARVLVPLHMALSGDRIAAEPVKFEVFEIDSNDVDHLLGTGQVDISRLRETEVVEMTIQLGNEQALHVVLVPLNFGLRPEIVDKQVNRQSTKCNVSDLRALDVRVLGAVVPLQFGAPPLHLSAFLSLCGQDEVTESVCVPQGETIAVWNKKVRFAMLPNAPMQLRLAVRGKVDVVSPNNKELGYRVLSVPELFDLNPRMEQKKWISLSNDIKLQVGVKPEIFTFPRSQVRALCVTVRDATELRINANCRWSVQLKWRGQPSSASALTVPKSNTKPPIIWNQDFDLPIEPSQPMELMVSAVEVPEEDPSSPPRPKATMAVGNVDLSEWALSHSESTSQCVPLLQAGNPIPITEVWLAVRPLLFPFPRKQLTGLEVTVADGRGFITSPGNQVSVTVNAGSATKTTQPAEAISRPVWGERMKFPIKSVDPLTIQFLCHASDKPNDVIAKGTVDLSTWGLDQELVRGWVLMDAGTETRLRIVVQATFQQDTPTYRVRESNVNIVQGRRRETIHSGDVRRASMAGGRDTYQRAPRATGSMVSVSSAATPRRSDLESPMSTRDQSRQSSLTLSQSGGRLYMDTSRTSSISSILSRDSHRISPDGSAESPSLDSRQSSISLSGRRSIDIEAPSNQSSSGMCSPQGIRKSQAMEAKAPIDSASPVPKARIRTSPPNTDPDESNTDSTSNPTATRGPSLYGTRRSQMTPPRTDSSIAPRAMYRGGSHLSAPERASNSISSPLSGSSITSPTFAGPGNFMRSGSGTASLRDGLMSPHSEGALSPTMKKGDRRQSMNPQAGARRTNAAADPSKARQLSMASYMSTHMSSVSRKTKAYEAPRPSQLPDMGYRGYSTTALSMGLRRAGARAPAGDAIESPRVAPDALDGAKNSPVARPIDSANSDLKPTTPTTTTTATSSRPKNSVGFAAFEPSRAPGPGLGNATEPERVYRSRYSSVALSGSRYSALDRRSTLSTAGVRSRTTNPIVPEPEPQAQVTPRYGGLYGTRTGYDANDGRQLTEASYKAEAASRAARHSLALYGKARGSANAAARPLPNRKALSPAQSQSQVDAMYRTRHSMSALALGAGKTRADVASLGNFDGPSYRNLGSQTARGAPRAIQAPSVRRSSNEA